MLAETVIAGRHDNGVSRDSLQGGMIMVLAETHYREA